MHTFRHTSTYKNSIQISFPAPAAAAAPSLLEEAPAAPPLSPSVFLSPPLPPRALGTYRAISVLRCGLIWSSNSTS